LFYYFQVESVTNQMHEMREEYESKLDRYARLLDARAARIKVRAEGVFLILTDVSTSFLDVF